MKTIQNTKLAILLLVGILFFSGLEFSEGFTVGPNYRNVSVDTTANITNARPEILNLTFVDPVTLTAGSTYPLEINVSIRDWNGGADLDAVNGTIFASTSSLGAANNNNSHYSNSSCVEIAQNGVYANYTCTFNVYYYANPGSWNVTVFANDTSSFQGNGSDSFSVNTLFALNVTSPIDYGDLAIEDTSANETANVTNFGNTDINVSVYGYGATPGDGLAMVCDQGNITIDNQKYSASIVDDFIAKTSLTGSSAQISGLTIGKQTTSTQVINTTDWQLFVPPNPFGVCNGTVVFQAESST